MDFVWTKDLAVGVKEIDIQHRVLFKKINDLLRSLDAGQEDEQVEEMFSFLDDYAASHFSMEQKAMSVYGYPEAREHKEQHFIFNKVVNDLRDNFKADGITESLIKELKERLCDWLVEHVSKVDRALGDFLRPRAKSL